MVYLKQIFNATLILLIIVNVGSTKIAYKKSINGKTNITKEKHLKPNVNEELSTIKSTTTATTTSTTIATTKEPTTTATTTTTLTSLHEELEVAETTHAIKKEQNLDEKPEKREEEEDDIELELQDYKIANVQNLSLISTSNEFREVNDEIDDLNLNQLEFKKTDNDEKEEKSSTEFAAIEEPPNSNELETNTKTTSSTTAPAATSSETTVSTTIEAPTSTSNNRPPTPCTCGVFMTSQIKRTGNPYEAPIGRPVIINELDRTYPCTAVGQKQCQTKCLETIVQHLPNSANILCASLDHDIRKERAYLFIKNCRNQWYNTNLAAGREYCCKNGHPYQCPLV